MKFKKSKYNINVDKLSNGEIYIYQTQITLDGVGEVHNKTTKLKRGQDSFSKITANIDNVSKRKDNYI